MTPVVVMKASKGGSSIGNAQFVLFGFKPVVATPSKIEGLKFPSLQAALNSSIVLVNADTVSYTHLTLPTMIGV